MTTEELKQKLLDQIDKINPDQSVQGFIADIVVSLNGICENIATDTINECNGSNSLCKGCPVFFECQSYWDTDVSKGTFIKNNLSRILGNIRAFIKNRDARLVIEGGK